MATTKKPGGKFTKGERTQIRKSLRRASAGKLLREEAKRGLAAMPLHVQALEVLKEPKRRIARAKRGVRAQKILLRVGKFKKAAA